VVGRGRLARHAGAREEGVMKRGDDASDSRRRLLAGLAASAAGAIAGCTRAAAAPAKEPATGPSAPRRNWGLVIDLDRCAR